MSAGVTPCAGEPEGLPFLQTTSLVPKAPVDPDPEVLAPAVVVDVPEDLSSLRPHAAATIAMTHSNTNHR